MISAINGIRIKSTATDSGQSVGGRFVSAGGRESGGGNLVVGKLLMGKINKSTEWALFPWFVVRDTDFVATRKMSLDWEVSISNLADPI